MTAVTSILGHVCFSTQRNFHGPPEGGVLLKINHLRISWWRRWLRICLQCGRPGFSPLVGKIPWRKEWLPTPVSLPGEFHGQMSLVGYSPWDHKESGITERLNTFTSLSRFMFQILQLSFSRSALSNTL